MTDPAPDNVIAATFGDTRHASGTARCMECRREWEAVIAWTSRLDPLECPGCGKMKGQYVNQYTPNDEVWRCDCGNDLMLVLRSGIFCPNCGEFAVFPYV